MFAFERRLTRWLIPKRMWSAAASCAFTSRPWSRCSGKCPTTRSWYDLAELFKVFGDSTRIKILYALFEAELCVCDIAQLLGLTQSAVSHQLRILKTNRLVKPRKDGKTVFYSLSDDHVRKIIAQGMDHIKE